MFLGRGVDGGLELIKEGEGRCKNERKLFGHFGLWCVRLSWMFDAVGHWAKGYDRLRRERNFRDCGAAD